MRQQKSHQLLALRLCGDVAVIRALHIQQRLATLVGSGWIVD
jgi:hypothetical protein